MTGDNIATRIKAEKLADEFGAAICRSRDIAAILMAIADVTAFAISTIECPACRHDATDAFGQNLIAQRARIEHNASEFTNGKLCRKHLEKLQ
jgi:hypothetical protein